VQRVTKKASAARRLKDEAMNIVMKAIFSEGPRGDKETKNKHGHCQRLVPSHTQHQLFYDFDEFHAQSKQIAKHRCS